MLIAVLFASDQDGSVDKNVVEQEELTRFRLFATDFGQNSFADQNATRNIEGLWNVGLVGFSGWQEVKVQWYLPHRKCRSSFRRERCASS
jgi:hypothetical protein